MKKWEKWLKTWGTLIALIVAVISLVVSGYSVWISRVKLEEVTKPYTLHSEIHDRLVMLDSRIERKQKYIQENGVIDQFQNKMTEASQLRDQAEVAWNAGNYVEADRLIDEDYEILSQVVIVVKPSHENWGLIIGGTVGGIIVIVLVILLVMRMRKK